MSLRNNLKSKKVKERYDRNQNSVETTFTQKELKEHDNQIREKAIDDFVEKLNDFLSSEDISYYQKDIRKIGEQLKNQK